MTFGILGANQRLAAFALIFLVPSRIVFAQDPKPAFEVASIKRYVGAQPGFNRFATEAGGKLSVSNNPILGVIVNAYSIKPNELAEVPDWVRSERYDIEARGPSSSSRKEMMLMLQTLLAERFAMKAHFEVRETSAYTLTIAKGGHKLRMLGTEDCAPRDPTKPGTESDPNVCGNNRVSSEIGWNATHISMAGVVGSLSAILRQPVIDQTGIKGAFDVRLQWSDDLATPDPNGLALPSIYTALRETLGLELKPGRTQVNMLVIDHIERPSAN
jgi:uncharacterized protein (TIGR03435 family)